MKQSAKESGEELYKDSIKELYGKFGKMSIHDFVYPVYPQSYPNLYASDDITFALSGTPLVYRGVTNNGKSVATALHFTSTLKGFYYNFAMDIRYFIDRIYDINGILRQSDGVVNRHLFEMIDNAGGYISLKDFIFQTIDFIGHREVYFTEEEVRVFDERYGETSHWIIHCEFK